jgi:hypothetical protein
MCSYLFLIYEMHCYVSKPAPNYFLMFLPLIIARKFFFFGIDPTWSEDVGYPVSPHDDAFVHGRHEFGCQLIANHASVSSAPKPKIQVISHALTAHGY